MKGQPQSGLRAILFLLYVHIRMDNQIIAVCAGFLLISILAVQRYVCSSEQYSSALEKALK